MADGALNRGLHGLVQTVAAAEAAAHSKDSVAGTALLAYRSFLDAYDVSIVASSEQDGYEAVNVKSRLTHSGWRPSAGGAQTLTFTAADNGQTVDYFAIAAHNLASKSATVALQYSDDGSAWTTLATHVPTSDAPFLVTVASTAKRRFQLVVYVSGDNLPTIGVVMLGQRLLLQRGIYVGHRPAPYSRDVVFNTSESEGGNIIGRSVVRRMNETEISLRRMTPSWFRAYLAPFQRAVEEDAFFFLWRTAYASEVIFGVLTNQPRPVNDHQSFMSVDYTMRGLA